MEEKKCKKCGTTEYVNFDGMCSSCYNDSIEIHEKVEEPSQIKDNKNIVISILSILLVLTIGLYLDKNSSVVQIDTSNYENQIADLTTQLDTANSKISSLENTNQELKQNNDDLTNQINSATSTEELQQQLDQKNQYILNLESQVGTLTAEKSQAEAQVGILQQQVSSSTSSTSSNNSTTTAETVYVTNTGNKYHRAGCSYLKSKNAKSKSDAISQGYTACSRCNP